MQAISFVPCFKYADVEDVVLFTSPHIHYLVDRGGQFNENYYGMKHELLENITSEQAACTVLYMYSIGGLHLHCTTHSMLHYTALPGRTRSCGHLPAQRVHFIINTA